MRVSKLFLSKIIKEEIKRILYEEAEEADELNATKRLAQIKSYNSADSDSGIERRLINLFVKYCTMGCSGESLEIKPLELLPIAFS